MAITNRLTAIADAIRAVDDTTDLMQPADMPDRIRAAGIPVIGRTLATYSWDEIAKLSKIAAKDKDSFTYLVGQTKVINMVGIGDQYVRLISVATDDLADGSGKAGFTFEFVNVVTSSVMNNVGVNSNMNTTSGWSGSTARTYLNNTFINNFPEPVKGYLKTVTKYSSVPTPGSASNNYGWGAPLSNVTNDKVFIGSVNEYIAFANNPVNSYNGYQYDWYKAGGTRVKTPISSVSTGSGQPGNWYWTRTQGTNMNYWCFYTCSNGTLSFGVNGAVGNSNRGLCPMFCI